MIYQIYILVLKVFNMDVNFSYFTSNSYKLVSMRWYFKLIISFFWATLDFLLHCYVIDELNNDFNFYFCFIIFCLKK